jgi:hypothetical protein
MLRPLPDLDNPEGMAKLGRLYALREAWRDAVTQLRDSVSMIQSTHSDAQAEGLKQAREAVERMELIQAAQR